MVRIKDLTIVIVTFRTNNKILFKCLDAINFSAHVIIVENSNDSNFKQILESKYSNLNVVLSGKNLGYGAGNNFGLERVKTKYALILNPDVIVEKNFFEEMNIYLEKKIDFHLMGSSQINNKVASAGFFNDIDKKMKFKNEKKSAYDSLVLVDWIVGCTMLINLEKFNTRKLFDENFFLYFEEFDLCRTIKLNNGIIYLSKNMIINHLGNKGSLATDAEYGLQAEIFRNWHWMWSTFYYFKKRYGYFYAVYKTYGKLFRSLFKMILFTILFNRFKRTVYYARFFGIINSMLGRKSWYRVKSLEPNDRENL